jgi:predicted enzyme related to lactoylglutathione lyase
LNPRGKEGFMANAFVHCELNTTDIGKAKTFFGKLFDWKLEDVPLGDMGTYTMIGVGDDGVGGGMLQSPMAGAPSVWIPYVLVDDVNAATEKARGLGAHVLRNVTEVQGMGTFTIIADPTGAPLGLWQAAAQ